MFIEFTKPKIRSSKMSIVCNKVENPSYWKVPANFPGYAQVTINPISRNEVPFPSDYKYFSCFLVENFVHCIDRIQNFVVRPDDIWILGFPKSGKCVINLNFVGPANQI